jgi:hypothetical protein
MEGYLTCNIVVVKNAVLVIICLSARLAENDFVHVQDVHLMGIGLEFVSN